MHASLKLRHDLSRNENVKVKVWGYHQPSFSHQHVHPKGTFAKKQEKPRHPSCISVLVNNSLALHFWTLCISGKIMENIMLNFASC